MTRTHIIQMNYFSRFICAITVPMYARAAISRFNILFTTQYTVFALLSILRLSPVNLWVQPGGWLWTLASIIKNVYNSRIFYRLRSTRSGHPSIGRHSGQGCHVGGGGGQGDSFPTMGGTQCQAQSKTLEASWDMCKSLFCKQNALKCKKSYKFAKRSHFFSRSSSMQEGQPTPGSIPSQHVLWPCTLRHWLPNAFFYFYVVTKQRCLCA